MADIHHLHRAKPRLVRPAPPELHREVASLDEWLNRRREPVPTMLSDYAAGAAVGFALGISQFLVMLVVMVLS